MIFLASVVQGDYTLALYRLDMECDYFVYVITKYGYPFSREVQTFTDTDQLAEWYADNCTRDVSAIKEGRL